MIPNGIGVETAWRNICEGRSGIGPITRFDASGFETRIAAEVKGFDPERYVEKKEIKKMDLFVLYALAATQEALEDANFTITPENGERVGVIVGTGLGGLPTLEKYHQVLLEKGPSRISPFFIPTLIANMAAGQIAIRFGAKGPNTCVVTACATGAHSIGDAFRAIRYGDADVIIAGRHHTDLSLTDPFLDAVNGATARVSLPNGDVVDLKIPPGATDGQVLRLRGKGLPGIDGGPPGDALVELAVAPHPLYRREGDTIRYDLPVALHEAVLGAKVEAPTPAGRVMLTVPPGSNTGTVLRLRGRGVARPDGTRGDCIVTLKLMLPPGPDPALAQFLRGWEAGRRHDPRAGLEG